MPTTCARRLLRVPDVAKVEIFGAQPEKLFIEISHKRLAQLGLDMNQVIAQLGAQNAVEGAGVLNAGTQNLQVRVAGAFDSVEELRALPDPRHQPGHGRGEQPAARRHRRDPARHVDPPAVKVRHQGKPVIALGVSMAKGGDIIALGQCAAARRPTSCSATCRPASR